jgi:hypothetical protein
LWISERWLRRWDSNQRPSGYEPCAAAPPPSPTVPDAALANTKRTAWPTRRAPPLPSCPPDVCDHSCDHARVGRTIVHVNAKALNTYDGWVDLETGASILVTDGHLRVLDAGGSDVAIFAPHIWSSVLVNVEKPSRDKPAE